ncbi:RNA polymerase beta chain [Dorcoceras hygrometricum]|uniref:RNA polymerase beta chain n=1 Tax=Dorcoceras hygrometricum TaxID=472368 RepID=A0A2Z7B632_9LAMI|nr:RNA polymerase beta chain [Dorcoceras hygrometricum]
MVRILQITSPLFSNPSLRRYCSPAPPGCCRDVVETRIVVPFFAVSVIRLAGFFASVLWSLQVLDYQWLKEDSLQWYQSHWFVARSLWNLWLVTGATGFVPGRDEYYMLAAGNSLALNRDIHEEQVVPARYRQEFLTIAWEQVHLRSIFPLQYFSIGASLIPFIEHNDANRALMIWNGCT